MASSIPLPDDIAQYLERMAFESNRIGFIRILPYDYEILAENLLDPAHVPFSHHGVIPRIDRSNAMAIAMAPVPPVTPNSIASVQFTNTALGFPRNGRLEFVDPALVMYSYLDSDPEKSNETHLTTLTPVRKGRSLILIQSIASGRLSGHNQKTPIHIRLLLSSPALIHMVNNSILDGDNVFLHIQEQNLRKEKKTGWTANTYFTPTLSDYMVIRFRNWLRKEGGGGPFGPSENQETSPISRRELLDRYESYTLQNKVGQKALASVNRSIAVFRILSSAFLLMGGATVVYSMQKGTGFIWQTVVCLSAFAFCFFVRSFLCNKILPLFYFVDYVHADKN